MELRFAHLADYAGEDRLGKLVIAGIFDQVNATTQRPIVMPSCWLVVQLEAHIVEGTDHAMELRVTNADGIDVAPRISAPIKFIPQGPGRPLRARILAQIGGLSLPDLGEYSFHLFVNGHRVADVILHVVAAQGAA
jgi:uncharacterized protein DUF6941